MTYCIRWFLSAMRVIQRPLCDIPDQQNKYGIIRTIYPGTSYLEPLPVDAVLK